MRYQIQAPGQQFSAFVRKENDVLAASNFIDIAQSTAWSLAERFETSVEIVDTEDNGKVVFSCKWTRRAKPGVVRTRDAQ